MTETKHDKFVRLSEARLEKALDAIRLLSNLVSSNYESSEDERRSVVDRLMASVNEVGGAYGLEMSTTPTNKVDVGLELIRIGPMLGQAYEALTLDNDAEKCSSILKELLAA